MILDKNALITSHLESFLPTYHLLNRVSKYYLSVFPRYRLYHITLLFASLQVTQFLQD